jgi:hypothetical protein
MINDRGRKKWAPFLMPEHKKRIAEMYMEEYDVHQPELDEQMLEQLQETIAEAIERETEVSVTYHSNKRVHTCFGKITKVNPFMRELFLDNGEGRTKIRFDLITSLIKK